MWVVAAGLFLSRSAGSGWGGGGGGCSTAEGSVLTSAFSVPLQAPAHPWHSPAPVWHSPVLSIHLSVCLWPHVEVSWPAFCGLCPHPYPSCPTPALSHAPATCTLMAQPLSVRPSHRLTYPQPHPLLPPMHLSAPHHSPSVCPSPSPVPHTLLHQVTAPSIRLSIVHLLPQPFPPVLSCAP